MPIVRKIRLTQGQVATVDADDYGRLNQHKWYALWSKNTRSFYAARKSRGEEGARREIQMHRVVMNTPQHLQTDHINHDTLDNRRENLRNCTRAENQHNSRPHVRGVSAFKGVSWHKLRAKWQAKIMVAGRRKFLGLFPDEVEAAKAYDEAAAQHFGGFAHINLPRV